MEGEGFGGDIVPERVDGGMGAMAPAIAPWPGTVWLCAEAVLRGGTPAM